MAEARDFVSSITPNAAFVFAKPPAGDDLLFSEELYAFFSLHMQVAKKRIAPTAKWEPCRRGWDGKINPNHACLGPVLKLAGCFARARKNGSSISIGRLIHSRYGGIEIIHPHHIEHWTEYLLARDYH